VAGEPGTVSKPVQVPWPIATFSGPDTAAPPVQASQLVTPLSDYIGYVDRRLAVLRGQLDTLSAEISSGQRGGAESAWLAAHLTWLQIGQDDGAYGAFGQLGASIDGTAAGLVGGSANPHFTGFHKLEFDLFSRRDLPAAARDASRLKALVGELTPSAVASDLPSTTSGLDNWILRCHEILEDALRDSLSADDDYGSNTDLASITADVTGTREMLGLLAPQIEARAPQLVATASTELTAVDQATAATRSHGRWAGVASLSLLQRQRIDAAVDAALETLAPVSDLMEIGNT
jgi:iron uptake system component EfeO